ncbi:MAG: hypothetical protein I3273_01910 [Candidatus Moeniiplasma glomeromycotorum]|nr:hypothetical protein [Candidatus Moeniiplasma glomeromycotorum]MCE8167125.1 hypothetical protein [Candidatus Moeniiplasma glomeromycotorum]MCE8168863.1 hypothetical protein [Candidatus Moeniiplasma glomeromycotorum]
MVNSQNTERLEKVQNNELLKEVQNRIITNSLSENEINVLTFTLIKKTGKCFFCGKIEEASKLMEIKLNEEEVKRILATKWWNELKRNSKERSQREQELIASYKRIASNQELQKELEIWDKIEEEDYE